MHDTPFDHIPATPSTSVEVESVAVKVNIIQLVYSVGKHPNQLTESVRAITIVKAH